MSENCDKCKKRNIGCDVIQQMNSDVRKLKIRKNLILYFAWLTYLFALIIGGTFVYRTFSQPANLNNS